MTSSDSMNFSMMWIAISLSSFSLNETMHHSVNIFQFNSFFSLSSLVCCLSLVSRFFFTAVLNAFC